MKKINNILMLFSLIATFFITYGCKDLKFGDGLLEKPISNDVNIDSVYSRKVYAIQALNQIYTTVPDGLNMRIPAWNYLALNYDLLESLTDLNNTACTWSSARSAYYSGQVNDASGTDALRCNFTNGGHWQGIRMAWVFIENVDRVPDMTDLEKKVCKGEAKALIGLHYLHMFRHFGGLPWVDRSYDANEQVDMQRMTVEDMVSKIAILFDEAAAVLPWTTDRVNSGRMTKAAAMGLKIRLLLFAASPLFNDVEPYLSGEAASLKYVWYGDKKDSRWQDVVAECEKFFTELNKEGGYSIVRKDEDYRLAFKNGYYPRSSSEMLVSCRAVKKYVGVWGERTFMEMSTYGTAGTTLDYVDMFQMDNDNGDEFDWNNPDHAANPFFTADGKRRRDPRLYETTVINQDVYQTGKAQTWIGGKERPTKGHDGNPYASGFVMRKFRLDINSTVGQYYNWPHLRLAEIYLSYAEALNEVSGGPTPLAYDMVKEIRDRVGMPNFPTNLTQPQFREELFRERAREFGYEEVRFFDLVRWKKADIFKKKLKGLDIRKDKNGNFTYQSYELSQKRAWQGDGWDAKWYLTPFPASELNKRYGLLQNPGW